MTAFMVLGRRLGDGANGIFIAPPGVDAHTAPISALLLAVDVKIPQLVMAGVSIGSSVVALGLGYAPFVLLTSYSRLGGVGFGNVRPFGNMTSGAGVASTVSVAPSAMTISTPFGSVGYLVFRQPA